MDQSRINEVKHLYEVERLSMRQIATQLKMCGKTVSLIVIGKERPKKAKKPSLIQPYLRLIAQWYEQYPSLRASQVYERLQPYGYPGRIRTRSGTYPEVPEEDPSGIP